MLINIMVYGSSAGEISCHQFSGGWLGEVENVSQYRVGHKRFMVTPFGVRHSRACVFVGEYGHFDARASSLRQDRFDAVQAIFGLARTKRHLRTRIWKTFWGGSAQNRRNWITWAEN